LSLSEILRSCPLFFELYETEIEKIGKKANVLTFQQGDFVVTDGEEGNEIYVVLEGKVSVQKRTPDGVIEIQKLNQGDIFGEMVLVDVNKRSADIIVVSHKAYIFELDFLRIYELFRKEPKIFGLIQLNLSRLLAKRLRNSNDKIFDIQKKLKSFEEAA